MAQNRELWGTVSHEPMHGMDQNFAWISFSIVPTNLPNFIKIGEGLDNGFVDFVWNVPSVETPPPSYSA